MKRQYVLIGVLLFISLWIYLFYRTERTVVNEILIFVISKATYTNLRASVTESLPLNDLVIYSLPEGLWIFCITLTSKPYYISLNKFRLDCMYVPLILCFSLEVLQLLHVTKGRFDFMDICVFVLFWFSGSYCLTQRHEKRHILSNWSSNNIVCLLSYAIVYLAHVLN
jgi:hypothetical protein